jgi:aspartate aminotransferase-like enzyme
MMKNFLPGPTTVTADILAVLAEPIIGHHTEEFRALIARLKPRLKRLLGTRHPVFPLTCTASAAMEAALINAAAQKILVLANGAFGERWLAAARSLNLPADGLILSWGLPLPEHEIGRVLDRTNCDTLVMVHGESSTGMLNPLEPVKNALKSRPEVLFILDAVATLGGVPLEMDADGVDILVGACQKCLALPPGVVPVGVSEKALKRSETSSRKGYATDFVLWKERWDENQTVATPAIPQLRALDLQLERIEKETLKARWKRHRRLSESTLEWARQHGWIPFAPEGYSLPSISCLRPLDGRKTQPIIEGMREEGYLIDGGYGKLKNRTLRIGHMGNCSEGDLQELLEALSAH